MLEICLKLCYNRGEIDMEIEEQRERFLSFLRMSFKAELGNQKTWGQFRNEDPERLTIFKKDLESHDFGNDDFWCIVCPSLVADGLLRKNCESIITPDGQTFPGAVFVVNGEKLVGSKSDKKCVSFDGDRTIMFRDRRHVFHAEKGEKGLPLRFFKLLWEKRAETRDGRQTKTGERRPESFYAVQLGIADDVSTYEKGTQAKVTISNLIKGLNRVFIDKKKKIPARVTSAGGVLLEIKNP